MELKQGFEWCRKGKYNVQIELGCYEITESTPLLEGFYEEEVEVDGQKKKYAVKTGTNLLEQNTWTTSPTRPYVVTGTIGERWAIKPSNLTAYDVRPEELGVEPKVVSTVDPVNQQFMVCVHIPEGMDGRVIPSWAFRADGTIDETQIMVANSPSSKIPHNGGDFIVAKHIDGQPEYMELPVEVRDTREMAKLYDPRVINGSVMATTYDHALTQDEIREKNGEVVLKA